MRIEIVKRARLLHAAGKSWRMASIAVLSVRREAPARGVAASEKPNRARNFVAQCCEARHPNKAGLLAAL